MATMDLRAKLNRAIAAKEAARNAAKEKVEMEVKLARAERLFEQVCDDVDQFFAKPSVARVLGPHAIASHLATKRTGKAAAKQHIKVVKAAVVLREDGQACSCEGGQCEFK